MEPVLIAGAGPVGLATALLLARWEIPSVVLEAAERIDPAGSRALCFQRDVLDILDRIGCASQMVAEGLTWTRSRTYYRSHELFTITFPDPGASPVPPWINISQARVEQLLMARALADPLIEVRLASPVTGVSFDDDGALVTLQGGQSVRGSHLVGADGPHSTVRDLLGIGFPGQSFPDQFLICDIRADLPFPSERRFYFDPEWNPGRQVLVHQCPAGQWRIDWQVPAGFDLVAERASGGLAATVRQITGDQPYEIIWATAYRFHQRVADRFWAGRAFLAGDAAHLFAPFGARGLNSGIADAENLAWKLAFVRHGWAPPDLLASYQAERAAAAAENLRVTSATMEFLVPQTSELRRRRAEVLDRAVTDASARSLINSGKLAEPYWYTGSPLTTPGPPLASFPTEPGAVRPPVPGVLCPDGPCSEPAGPCREPDEPCREPDEPCREMGSSDGHGAVTRLRRLLGHSFVIITRSAAVAARAGLTAQAAGAGPVTALALAEIDVNGVLGPALDATATSVHVVRPDGHLAAVLPDYDPVALAAALSRAAGWPPGASPAASATTPAMNRSTPNR